MRVQVHGANAVDPGTAATRPAPADGVFPEDFYSTTNLDTFVRLDREWLRVDRAGDGLRAGRRASEDGRPVVRTVPVSDVRAGEAVVCGAARRAGGAARRRRRAARRRPSGSCPRRCPARSRRRCWSARSPSGCARSRPPGSGSCGSAGRRSCTPAPRRRWCGWSRAGYVDVLFAGNALATHDIESVAVRHLARRRPGQGLRRAARPRAPHPGDQHDPGGRLDRRRRGVRRADRRGDARDGARPASRSCWSARSATTARCPTSTPT